MTMTKLEANAAALKRWRTRLKRAMTMIDKLEKQRRRLETAAAKPKPESKPDPKPAPEKVLVTTTDWPALEREKAKAALPQGEPLPAVTVKAVADELGIPEFLKRGATAQAAVDKIVAEQIKAGKAETADVDKIAAEQIKADKADTKRRKAHGRIATLKADKRGDRKKMPLTGRAALDAIRNSE